MLMVGNITPEEARKFTNSVKNWLKNSSKNSKNSENSLKFTNPENLNSKYKDIILPKKSKQILKSKTHPNSAIDLVYFAGEKNLKNRALSCLFGQVISDKVFSSLRTEQQLGYIVHGGTYSTDTVTGTRIIVQSDKDPLYLQYRIEEFWRTTFRDYLENKDGKGLSEQEFQKITQAWCKKTLEEPKNLSEDQSNTWVFINNGTYNFKGFLELVKYIENNVTLQDMKEYYENVIINNERVISSMTIGSSLIEKYEEVERDMEKMSEIGNLDKKDLIQEILNLINSYEEITDPKIYHSGQEYYPEREICEEAKKVFGF